MAIISLNSINGFVFITETQHVFCAVGNEFLYIIQADLMLKKVKLLMFSCPTILLAPDYNGNIFSPLTLPLEKAV
jgi:hypothetical protein